MRHASSFQILEDVIMTAGLVSLHPIAKKKLDCPPVLQRGIWGLDYSPCGKVLAIGGADGMIRVWDLATCQSIREMQAAKEYLEAVRYSPDGVYLAAVTRHYYGQLTVWNLATGKRFQQDRVKWLWPRILSGQHSDRGGNESEELNCWPGQRDRR